MEQKVFFAQGFLGYYTGDDDEFEDEKFNSFEVGVGLGRKWVNKKGFIVQVLIGCTRTISETDSAPDGIFHVDLYFGYRF